MVEMSLLEYDTLARENERYWCLREYVKNCRFPNLEAIRTILGIYENECTNNENNNFESEV